MKQELIDRGFEFADDVEWEKDEELFWIPMRRWDDELGANKDAGKV
jgi:hypothetical protein